MNSAELELVTAYVDGEATEDERARVEADADLLAEVERQRSARAAMHDVGPPSAVGHEATIAAALAVFDENAESTRPAAPAAVPLRDVTAPTNIVPFDQRRRLRWVQRLGAAAAVTAVVAAGAVIATRNRGDDGSTADELRENAPPSVVAGTLGEEEAAQASAAASDVATSADDVLMAIEPTADAAADAADAAPGGQASEYDEGTFLSESAPAAAPPTLGAPSAAAPATTVAAPVVVISTELDLLELAETLKAAPLDLEAAESECSAGLLKADATFDDGGDRHPVIVVAVDEDRIGALALDDCAVVLEADR